MHPWMKWWNVRTKKTKNLENRDRWVPAAEQNCETFYVETSAIPMTVFQRIWGITTQTTIWSMTSFGFQNHESSSPKGKRLAFFNTSRLSCGDPNPSKARNVANNKSPALGLWKQQQKVTTSLPWSKQTMKQLWNVQENQPGLFFSKKTWLVLFVQNLDNFRNLIISF